MRAEIPGIHHVTAIAGDPQRNLDFYAGILGLRLVKRTVNFDDPGTYHLYYGDDLGRPGSLLTFFTWRGAADGRRGSGQATSIAFSVPEASLRCWEDRLGAHGVPIEQITRRFDEEALSFSDPDGLHLELVGVPRGAGHTPRRDGPLPPEHAILGLHGVTLTESSWEETSELLTGILSFHLIGEEGNRMRFETGEQGTGSRLDLLRIPGEPAGRVAVGTVHHVAWRTATDEEQRLWRRRILAEGLDSTPIIDRGYFRSIYFREPGGVLFEIATDPPGFAVDEEPEHLGEHLMLPEWLERRREWIEKNLPELVSPGFGRAA
jgi:glyoxalase family protein